MNLFAMCAGEIIGESRDGHTELALSHLKGPPPVSSKGTSFSLEQCEPTAWFLRNTSFYRHTIFTKTTTFSSRLQPSVH
jgi:hypothetical protein